MTIKLARTIRFDSSDLNIFNNAADEGEWALPASFLFAHYGKDDLVGKTRQAFANGFVGFPSLGCSTFVSVATIKSNDYEMLRNSLSKLFLERFNAPSKKVAISAADEEINFMQDICEQHKTGTLLTITRVLKDDGIKESFRSISKGDSCAEQEVWTIIEDEKVDI